MTAGINARIWIAALGAWLSLSAQLPRAGASLLLEVQLPAEVFPEGRTITATLVWRNSGAEPAAVWIPPTPFSRVLAFDVQGEGGAVPSGVKWSGPGEDGALSVLEPGASARAEYDVTVIYPDLLPGSYWLAARYEDGTTSARSPRVPFRIEPPGPGEGEVLAAYRAARGAAERETVIERALEVVARDPAGPVAKRARVLLFDNYWALGDWEAAADQARRLLERDDLSAYERAETAARLGRATAVLRCLVGDCDRNQRVEAAELSRAWKLLFDSPRLLECLRLDGDGNARVTAGELVGAIRNASGLCQRAAGS